MSKLMSSVCALSVRSWSHVVAAAVVALGVVGEVGAADRVTQNFDGMSGATAALPSGWKFGAGSANWSDSGNTTACTLNYGSSGTGVVTGSSSGGAILWVNGAIDSSTERAIGFLTTGSYTGPRAILHQFTNSTGSTLYGLAASWDYEKYRSGTRAFDWTFAYSTDGTTWTQVSAGAQSYAADGSNTVVTGGTATAKTGVPLVTSLANGASIYLRWTYTGSGGSTNGQGLGIDNFRLFDSAPVATVTASGGANPSTDGWTLSTSGSAGSFQGNSANNGSGGGATTSAAGVVSARPCANTASPR